MFKIIFFNTLILTIIAIIQISFVSALPSVLSNLNIILVTLIATLIIKKFEIALYYSVFFGIILSIFLFEPFGFYIIIFVLLAIIGNFLLNNFFADRSIYSFLAIGIIMTIGYTFLIKISQYLIIIFTKSEFTTSWDYIFFINLLSSVFLNSLFIILIFQIIDILHKGLRPIFLGSPKKHF